MIASLSLMTPEAPVLARRLGVSRKPRVQSLPRLERLEGQGPVLHPGPLPGRPDVLSLNVAAGCAHRCPFCPARANAAYPGDEVVYLFTDTCDRLARELDARAVKPRAVYLSPATDPFPPVAAVQEETLRVVDVLAGRGIETLLMTRGYIRPAALRALAGHGPLVKVTVGLTTLDRSLQAVLEPLAAPPRLRLKQIAELRRLGIPVHVALEPLVPGLTDTRRNLAELLEALALHGTRHVTTGYLFLRQGMREPLARALDAHGWAEQVLEAFADGPVLQPGGTAPARYLSKSRRQRGYAALMALAADHGITVHLSGSSNADFRSPPRAAGPAPRQPVLPMFQPLRLTRDTVTG